MRTFMCSFFHQLDQEDGFMQRLVLGILLIIPFVATAQQDTVKVPPGPWSHNVVFGLTLTQVAFKDWTQGGENALSYTVSLDGKTQRIGMDTDWINSYKFAFGQTRLGIQGLRKTDDKIDLESVLSYKVGTYVNPYAAATLKTQFALGFKYDPATGARTAVSKFFDPAYLTQSVGFGYQPAPEIKTRFGAGLREVITSIYAHYADDPKTTIVEKTSVNGGFESVTNAEWKFAENMMLTAKLELFAAFNQLDEVILRSDNSLSAKVNKFVSVIVNVQFINDRRTTPRTQIKETIGLGLTYTLL
jgi:hypothetical protein